MSLPHSLADVPLAQNIFKFSEHISLTEKAIKEVSGANSRSSNGN